VPAEFLIAAPSNRIVAPRKRTGRLAHCTLNEEGGADGRTEVGWVQRPELNEFLFVFDASASQTPHLYTVLSLRGKFLRSSRGVPAGRTARMRRRGVGCEGEECGGLDGGRRTTAPAKTCLLLTVRLAELVELKAAVLARRPDERCQVDRGY
jgi:hypothetical protein